MDALSASCIEDEEQEEVAALSASCIEDGEEDDMFAIATQGTGVVDETVDTTTEKTLDNTAGGEKVVHEGEKIPCTICKKEFNSKGSTWVNQSLDDIQKMDSW